MNWIKRHKFWSAIIVVSLASMLLDAMGVVSAYGIGRVLGVIVAVKFILFGWRRRKKEVK